MGFIRISATRSSRSLFLFFGLALILFNLNSSVAWGWAYRGHHVVCQTAAYLVKDKNLRSFLEKRSDTLGYICNIPDIYWKNLGPTEKSADSSHYLNPEDLGLKLDEIPLDFQKLSHALGLTPRETDRKMGSLWWRANQFYLLAIDSGIRAAKAPLPKAGLEKFDDKLPYNQAVFEMFVNLGLVGHFFGDASMPFHNSADFDGWAQGHGGIHSYYEEYMVTKLGPSLNQDVFAAALRLQEAQQTDLTVLDPEDPNYCLKLIRSVSIASSHEIQDVLDLDTLQARSLKKSHLFARRLTTVEKIDKFRPLITQQLARSALALAQTWDSIYQESKKPRLDKYTSFRYPFQPGFVSPDYAASNEISK